MRYLEIQDKIIPFRDGVNALATLTFLQTFVRGKLAWLLGNRLRVFMGGEEHLLLGGSNVYLHHENTIEQKAMF
ncbi:hypothetical protein EVAR_39327_1 [Eumeta japonica]|uniref:Uncharacterized protein n=1 Tax=Eumeta variegata TaxID=151549 RepID=A0A4C1WR53_EUMVA|nr:hypothetical protein EVAR_39327_1 [Eumeta japonica]